MLILVLFRENRILLGAQEGLLGAMKKRKDEGIADVDAQMKEGVKHRRPIQVSFILWEERDVIFIDKILLCCRSFGCEIERASDNIQTNSNGDL